MPAIPFFILNHHSEQLPFSYDFTNQDCPAVSGDQKEGLLSMTAGIEMVFNFLPDDECDAAPRFGTPFALDPSEMPIEG